MNPTCQRCKKPIKVVHVPDASDPTVLVAVDVDPHRSIAGTIRVTNLAHDRGELAAEPTIGLYRIHAQTCTGVK